MNVNEWVCVPREATEMMRNWGVTAWNFNVSTPKNVYEAMLAAAPTPAPVPVDPAELEAMRAAQRLIYGFMLDVNVIGISAAAALNLTRGIKAHALAANGEKN